MMNRTTMRERERERDFLSYKNLDTIFKRNPQPPKWEYKHLARFFSLFPTKHLNAWESYKITEN